MSAAELVEAYVGLHRDGLIGGAAGNISVLDETGTVWVTPGGVPARRLTAKQVCQIDLASGRLVAGEKPTSELHLHLAVLRGLPDFRAVVHTHSPYATAFACARQPLEFTMNESLAARASQVLCTEVYHPPGSVDLGEEVLATLRKQPGSRAALLSSHGLVAVGDTLDAALSVASAVEWNARVSLLSRVLGGPVPLNASAQDAMARTYGVIKA